MTDKLDNIIAKCEQYWNAPIEAPETHAALEQIHTWAHKAKEDKAALEQKLEAYMEMARINTDFKLMALGCQEENSILEQRVKRLDKLIPYTDHVYSTCTSASGRQLKCLCGLDAALALAEETA